MHRVKTVAVSLGVLAAVSLAPAYSQNQPTPSGISDQKLDQAAAAIVHVDKLQRSYQQKLEQAPPDERDHVIEEADDALAKAVTDHGLSIDEYDTILQTAQNDPAIREKLLQRLDGQKK
jgi:Domain of unknown function (DUF4168)